MNVTVRPDEFREPLLNLERWSAQAKWMAYDTFDGLSSPYASILTANNPFLRRVWQQGVRRFPINLRPILGIKPAHSTKGMGFFAQGYLRLYKTTGQQEYLDKMRHCLDFLQEKRCPQFKGNAWANHFDYESRSGRIALGTPTVVWTSLIGNAFVDAYEELGEVRYLDVARGAAEFIVNELGYIETSKNDICLSYTPLPGGKPIPGEYAIHNSNTLGAGLLARVNSHAPKPRYLEIAESAMKFTMRDQLDNGGWYYGNHPKWHWVDSFHTGYVLESLEQYIRCKKDFTFQNRLEKGYKFFIDTFFGEDGTPRYYDYKTPPLDIQCASQAIQTLVNLRALDSRSIDTAVRVARWTIANMQDPTGYFYYRKYPLITNKTATLHWGQATMLGALALLDRHLNAKPAHVKA